MCKIPFNLIKNFAKTKQPVLYIILIYRKFPPKNLHFYLNSQQLSLWRVQHAKQVFLDNNIIIFIYI